MRTDRLRIQKKVLDRLKAFPARPSFSAGAVRIVVMVVAITVISFLAVDIFYKAVGMQLGGGAARQMSRPGEMAAAGQARPIQRYDVITERNLFMTTNKAVVQQRTMLMPSEEYTAYDLKGTIAINDSMGYAVVEEKGKGKQKLFRIGEMIGSARLVRVTRNAAILVSGGREMVMKIKEPDSAPSLGQSYPFPGQGIAVSRQEVTQSLNDLKSIMSQAVVRPFMNEGVQQGYVISNIVPGSLYERLGLKNGDVIQEVNGRILDSADDVLQLVNVMQAGGNISVNLLRNGKIESINYSFH